jgi:hypothetical protein
MRKFLLPAVTFVALTLAAIATPAFALRISVVAPYRASQAQGYLVAVRGHADIQPDSVHQGTDVNLVDDNGRVVFVGFIPKLNAYAFPQAAALNGKMVVMYGIIEIYQGRPATQLILSDQLRSG